MKKILALVFSFLVIALPANAALRAASSSSNAATATALAANGANCSAGSYPLGVDASGASESCTALQLSGLTNVRTNDSTYLAVGASAAPSLTGANNTVVGINAANLLTSGVDNTALGVNALVSDVTGSYNVALGKGTLSSVTGDSNIAIGWNAGSTTTTGTNNILIGVSAVAPTAGTSNYINLGDIYKVSGTGTPSTSASTIAGTLNVVGALTQNGVAVLTTRDERTIAGVSVTSTPSTGQIGFDIAAACSGTFTAYIITADAGTATIKIWKKAAGTAVATVADNISTSGFALSSNTSTGRVTDLTDLSGTSFSQGDHIGVNLSAVSGVNKLDFQLFGRCN